MTELGFIIGFEAVSTLTIKSTVFWVVMPCRSEGGRRFGGIYRHHIQSRVVEQETSICRRQASAGFVAWFTRPQDGGDIFLRNVGLSSDYIELNPKYRKIH
jgi:hypothetical protein